MTPACCLSLMAAAQLAASPPMDDPQASVPPDTAGSAQNTAPPPPVRPDPEAPATPVIAPDDATAILPTTDPAETTGGKLKLGGAIRARIDVRPFDVNDAGERRTSAHLSYDTLLLTADYDSPVIFGSAQYRFYGASFLYPQSSGYDGKPWDIHFPVYAYVGARVSETDRITVGIQPVPFDDRWWGSSWYDSLGFVVGMEEVYNTGISYGHAGDRLSVDVGYFPVAGPPGVGMSEDSARFTVNVVEADPYVPGGSRNGERDMLAGRVQYRLGDEENGELTLSASAWFSAIHNFDTGKDGRRHNLAFSLRGTKGPWRSKLLAARQDIDTRNEGRRDVITVGDYDSSYNIAARGTMLFGEVARTIETGDLPFDLSVYTSYARFLKDAAGFRDTQRINLGAFWTDKAGGNIRVWSEVLVGRNDPYVGAGQFLTGAAEGGDDRWKASGLIMMGYYF